MPASPKVFGALIALLFAMAVVVQSAIVRQGPLELPAGETGEVLYMQSTGIAGRAALGFDLLAADVYWIRALQHYGNTKLSNDPDKSYALLFPLLDLTTSLDPEFDVAYRYGAIFLAEPFPAGPGRPDVAIGLLEKGLHAQPDEWRFAQDIGFIQYWWLNYYEAAAATFQRAAAFPDAPNWMAPLAAVTAAQGGSREASRRLWEDVMANANVEWLREQGEFRLRQLDAMDQMDALEQISLSYEASFGTLPQSWQDLTRAGMLAGVPVDPHGFPYRLNPYWGTASLEAESTLNPLPAPEMLR